MNQMIKGFMRVVRGVDDADELIKHLPEIEDIALSNPSSITEKHRLLILDFPDPAIQEANIAASSSLTKSDLLKRAADTPSTLTETELKLLYHRYWFKVKFRERNAHLTAVQALCDVSETYYDEIVARLNTIRAPLYKDNEEKAIRNAAIEINRRRMDDVALWKAERRERSLKALKVAKPWVRKLSEEVNEGESWGYMVFVDPAVRADSQKVDDYFSRRDMALLMAKGAICCGEELSMNWRLAPLNYWPDTAAEGGEIKDGLNENGRRAVRFSKLRKYFKSAQEEKAEKQKTMNADSSTMVASAGVPKGILGNVFLVDDMNCLDSVMEPPAIGNVDSMWIWAVDPDYEGGSPQTAHSSFKDNQEEGIYEGYMRVRVQQLVNNFYCARRFHAEKYSMEGLWRSAQKSVNRAFVSLDEKEAGLYSMSRDIGAGMRP